MVAFIYGALTDASANSITILTRLYNKKSIMTCRNLPLDWVKAVMEPSTMASAWMGIYPWAASERGAGGVHADAGVAAAATAAADVINSEEY